MNQEDEKELLLIENKFENAMSEFIKQSGYIEGTLDTMISIMMDTCPEIAMTSDKLIKAFHSVEGICKQGFSVAFKELLDLYRSSKEVKTLDTKLDESIALLTKKTKGSK